MAVAFSTGGSGYPRSDFMISDAAIPTRVEEAAKEDQTERFSSVLSGVSGSKNAVRDTAVSDKTVQSDKADRSDNADKAVKAVADNSSRSERFDKFEKIQKNLTAADGSLDMQKLVKAVADGEISLDEIPQELFTDEMLLELVKLVKQITPAEKDDDPKQSEDPAVHQFVAELASMMNQTAVPEEISDLSEEVSALMGRIAEVTDEVQQAAPEVEQSAPEVVQNEQIQQAETTGEPVKFAVQTDSAEQKPQAEAKPVQAEQHETSQTAVVETAVRTDENTSSQSDGQAESQSGQGSQQMETSAQTAQVAQSRQTAPQENTRFREEIGSTEVRTYEKPEEAPQQEQPQIFADHTAQRSRVVLKSDELEAIRSGGEKIDDTAQTMTQPQTVSAETPVVFMRHDGTEVTVKPAEVAQQVAGKLTERAADLKEGEIEYSVTLEPQDLGRITVRMTKTADGTVSVSIAAENSKTLKIIEDNGSAIQNSLKQNGVQLENWQTVSESRQEAQAQDYQGSSKNPYRESENHRQDDDADDKSFAEIIASM